MGLLKRLFGSSPPCSSTFQDPVLGVLNLDEEVWKKAIGVGGRHIYLSVGGDMVPHPDLLQSAAKGEAELDKLLSQVPFLLQRKAEMVPILASEIQALSVDEVSWWWEKEPEAAMVWFHGGAEGRVWHATYRGGVLQELAFDD